VPPELSDEVCGEGATEFTDYEQAGLGEGEGVKNVSDEIEDEDQVQGERMVLNITVYLYMICHAALTFCLSLSLYPC